MPRLTHPWGSAPPGRDRRSRGVFKGTGARGGSFATRRGAVSAISSPRFQGLSRAPTGGTRLATTSLDPGGEAMSVEVERWVSRIRQEILAHIENHPRASDTTDGIAQWWLTTTAPAPLPLVNTALERLVAEG